MCFPQKDHIFIYSISYNWRIAKFSHWFQIPITPLQMQMFEDLQMF